MTTGKRGRATRGAPLIATKPGDPLVTCTKRSYPDAIEAGLAARERRKASGLAICAYKCPFGDHWHIGKQRKGKRAR